MKHLPPMTDKLPSITINPLLIHYYESGNNSLFLPVQPPHRIATAIGTAAAGRPHHPRQSTSGPRPRWSRKPPKKPLNKRKTESLRPSSGLRSFGDGMDKYSAASGNMYRNEHPAVIFVFHKQKVRQDCKTCLPVKPPVSDPEISRLPRVKVADLRTGGIKRITYFCIGYDGHRNNTD